ncbi:hypothetical protein N0V88_007041 [Collariella sp. IMI 366227]|nr:hypothetical protein N0V88_007041 [Collariella sp. IMI 366227]
MPHYCPSPVPAHVLQKVDDEEPHWRTADDMEWLAQNRTQIQALCAPINAIYDSGTPLFTTAAIRDLIHQHQIDEAGLTAAERVAAEHALVLGIRDFFAARRHDPAMTIPCYTQDPVYQDVDQEVLAELGMTVLDHPRRFLEVDEAAVGRAEQSDNISPRVEVMIKDYAEFPFPS